MRQTDWIMRPQPVLKARTDTAQLIFLILLLFPLPALCAPPKDPTWTSVLVCHQNLRREGLADSHLRHVRGKPFLAFREGDIQRLQSKAMTAEELADLIRKGAALAGREAVHLLPRLSAEGTTHIAAELPPQRFSGGFKKDLLKAYLTSGEREATSVLHLNGAERRQWIEDTLDDLEPSIKTRGRLFRRISLIPAAPFVYAWMGQHIWREYKGPKTPEFKQYLVYQPDTEASGGALTRASRNGEPPADFYSNLLRRFAPVIVQEIPESPSYPGTDDLIGKLKWAILPEGKAAIVPDWREPAVYSYYQLRTIGGEPVIQLIYTHWYAEHPPLKFADAEAGRLEGLTVRITLDVRGRPLIYETIYDCGCYHRMHVSRRLEELARRRFGDPLPGKTYSIEQKTRFKIDLIVLDTLPEPEEGQRPILFCWAAYHLPGKITLGEYRDLVKGTNMGEKGYELLPYRALETTKLDSVPVGIFNRNGLVYGAGRPEGLLLSPSGIFYAGHPRQRGTQLIHFDQEDFEDPDLFVNRLRWPGVPKG